MTSIHVIGGKYYVDNVCMLAMFKYLLCTCTGIEF